MAQSAGAQLTESGVALCIVDDNSTGGQGAACSWETRAACGSHCRKAWWEGFKSCCPPPAKPQMDWMLWSMLPDELVERILERLPASSQIRSQVVCKKWLSVLTSPAFLQRSALSALSSGQTLCAPWDIHRDGADGNSNFVSRLKKLNVDVPCACRTRCEEWFSTHVFQEGEEAATLWKHRTYNRSWQNGLLCIWCHSENPQGLQICIMNPVNGTWMELPFLATPSVTSLVRIIAVPGRDSELRVMVRSIKSCECQDLNGSSSCKKCRFWCFNVYCSKTGAWSQTTSTKRHHPPLGAASSLSGSHLFINGLLYVILDSAADLLLLSGENGKVVRKLTGLGDGGIHGWADIKDSTFFPCDNLVEHKFEILLEHRGDIYCVASNKGACSIWKLVDEGSTSWSAVSIFNWVPIQVSTDEVEYDLVSAVVMGNVIYASFRRWDWDTPGAVFLLSYNIRDSKWRTIGHMVSETLFAPRPNLYLSRRYAGANVG